MLLKRTLFIAFLALLSGSVLMAQDFKYIGADKCKMCHNKPEKGEQYNKWAAGPHASAMKTLSTDAAKKIAAAKGIADPSKDAGCTKCHSTAASVDAGLVQTLTAEESVSCESCHGPGSRYRGASIMKNQQLSLQNGMILPEEAVCKKCHNSESPSFKGFNYSEYVAKIAHDDPTTN